MIAAICRPRSALLCCIAFLAVVLPSSVAAAACQHLAPEKDGSSATLLNPAQPPYSPQQVGILHPNGMCCSHAAAHDFGMQSPRSICTLRDRSVSILQQRHHALQPDTGCDDSVTQDAGLPAVQVNVPSAFRRTQPVPEGIYVAASLSMPSPALTRLRAGWQRRHWRSQQQHSFHLETPCTNRWVMMCSCADFTALQML